MSAYATTAQLIERFDARVLGDIASDDGAAVSEPGLAANPKLLAALNSASGEVEASVIAGGIYTVAQLVAMTGNAQYLLVDLTCCVAMCKLLKRRASSSSEALMKAVCEDAREMIQSLRKGEAVFGGTSASDGQLPETIGPTTATFTNLNMMRDRTRNYYPHRALPFNR